MLANEVEAVRARDLAQFGRQLRALGVSSRERAPSAPDIPTLGEAGITGYNTTTWFGLFAPPKLNAQIVQTLNDATRKSFDSADARKSLTARGVEPILNLPDQFKSEIEAELGRWRAVTAAAKISLD